MTPCTTTSGAGYNEFKTTLGYLRDIYDLPEAYKSALANHDKLAKVIPKGLQEATPQRPLEFGTAVDSTTGPNVAKKFTPNKLSPGLMALFVFVAGNLAPTACGKPRCERMLGECVVADASYRDSLSKSYRHCCASCIYNHNSTRCSLFVKL